MLSWEIQLLVLQIHVMFVTFWHRFVGMWDIIWEVCNIGSYSLNMQVTRSKLAGCYRFELHNATLPIWNMKKLELCKKFVSAPHANMLKKINILQNALHEENIHKWNWLSNLLTQKILNCKFEQIFHINLVSVARFTETE